jgi:hypothetical protein
MSFLAMQRAGGIPGVTSDEKLVVGIMLGAKIGN